MRVIAGTARGRRLKAPRGWPGRPTADRVKEALFNILAARVPGSSFLDLFAGTGNVGIEALSRGAERAVFVEKDGRAVRAIEENLAATGLEGRAQVLKRDMPAALAEMAGRNCFDLIFVDPPYGRALEKKALDLIGGNGLLASGGWVIVESGKREILPREAAGLILFRQERYGDTMLSLYVPAQPRRSDGRQA
ncbi:16S rRNA (guanine(966)-N(2))-methyltransferase RsmD [Desulfotomaculum copahuensis]|uniref:16S rRNA (Guanine(966)-N(2))-methyltransferase RsmD n=1 Tax=Desulfotomaculum copahuensis TaxID=1838280 RepID=A0A1B7LEX1_9FIRM|nr:16S rRNA (guanine(966)-N(2))-methyltransferase RsmD [Desulfotomaculum copahuensis]